MEWMEIFSNGISMRLSQEMDSLMSMMYSQKDRAVNSAISVRIAIFRVSQIKCGPIVRACNFSFKPICLSSVLLVDYRRLVLCVPVP